MNVLDLFAGPGGWDVAVRDLGLDPLGIEYDDAACETRKAAGHRTLQADVAALDPADFAPCDLLIASPPCQAWSMAGKRGGEADIGLVYELTNLIAGKPSSGSVRTNNFTAVQRDLDGKRSKRGSVPYERDLNAPAPTVDTNVGGWEIRPDAVDGWEDERSRLVTEPLRWALALRPRFIACEQVPPVLDYWKHVAEILRGEGYYAWAGILSAEQYGVPQTRKRAILMASLDGPVQPPEPTHQRYVSGEPAQEEHTLAGVIRPWVSMAQALGWANQEQTLRTGTNTSKHPRDTQHDVPYERPVDAPAPTVDAKVGGAWKRAEPGEHRDPPHSWKVGFPRNDDQGGDGYRERDFRDQDEPAFTVTEKSRSAIKMRANAQENACERDADEPAPTITGGNDTGNRKWVTHDRAVRVTEQEAATLQGFPPDYPWQGSRTKRFQQIGNAVPPTFARAILLALVSAALEERLAA